MDRILLVSTLAVLALVVLTGALGSGTSGRYQIASPGGLGTVFRLDTQTGEICELGYGDQSLLVETFCGKPGQKIR